MFRGLDGELVRNRELRCAIPDFREHCYTREAERKGLAGSSALHALARVGPNMLGASIFDASSSSRRRKE
jgi:hypothetical protein